jgi:hypothetical protein
MFSLSVPLSKYLIVMNATLLLGQRVNETSEKEITDGGNFCRILRKNMYKNSSKLGSWLKG